MLQLSNNLVDKSILSLRTGAPIATITGAIINPDNLKIEGFYCQDKFSKSELILLPQDIRDVIPNGYVVNDHDVLVEAEDLIRLQKVLNLDFQLIGKHVQTVSKHRVGKVTDFATEVDSMFIQKIYVAQSIIKNFTGGSLSVDRSQVTEITDKKIIIEDLLKTSPAGSPVAAG